MIRWERARVSGCAAASHELQELEVCLDDGSVHRALHYTDVFGPVRVGDEVLLNTTAVSLELGSGGFHFVHAVLNRREGLYAGSRTPAPGHIMKLRYTPQQRAVLAAEEPDSPHHAVFREPRDLSGMPVLIGELHSMLPVALCWLRYVGAPHRIAYIMSDGGALPLAYSRHAAHLRRLGWLCGTVTYGQAYGGDLETLNKFTALIAARHILRADLAVVAMGPGIAGTGTRLGHSGVEVGELINAVSRLRGKSVVMPRLSFADARSRHRGLSHHLLHGLSDVAYARAILPLPDRLPAAHRSRIEEQLRSVRDGLYDIRWMSGCDPEEIAESQRLYPEPITTMGRGVREDAAFFQAVCAAASAAAEEVPTDGL